VLRLVDNANDIAGKHVLKIFARLQDTFEKSPKCKNSNYHRL